MLDTDMSIKRFSYPFISSIVYILVSHTLSSYKGELNQLYKTSVSYKRVIKYTGASYNVVMSIFSGTFFCFLCSLLLDEYKTIINFKAWLNGYSITNKQILNLCWIFCHSKTVEYFDTFFVLLKGGTPIFLQKYHHFGAVWTWFLILYVDSSACINMSLFNSFVHTIMYAYYFLSIFDRYKVLQPVKPLITSLQLLQLSSGFYIGLKHYVLHHFNRDSSVNEFIITGSFFLLYDIVLILLFLQFVYNQYIKKSKRV